jgi:cardiolipin synthase (CMP-forming)
VTTDQLSAHRIATIPNGLSLARLAILGIALGILFGSHNRIAAAILLFVAGTTDFLDGYIARRFNQVSELGKILDPTVDRIVLGSTLIAIVVYGAVPIWLGVVVLAREALVSGAALLLAARGAEPIDVIFIGKAGAFALMATLPSFLLADGTGLFAHVVKVMCWVCVFPAFACALAAMVAYVPRARVALRAAAATR